MMYLSSGISRLYTVAIISTLLSVIPGRAVAQASPDSISAWTALLQSASIADRAHAYSRLGGLDPIDVPQSTQVAILAELTRINQDALNGVNPIIGPDGGEGLSEAFTDLALLAARFNTTESRLALIAAIDISSGFQRQVARLGDLALPTLELMIERDVSAGAALRVYGFAWFWADSTGAPLSDAGRSTILTGLLDGMESQNAVRRYEAATALGTIGDPAFRPLALVVAASELSTGEPLIGRTLELDVLPGLDQVTLSAGVDRLLANTQRVLSLFCTASPRNICADAQASLASAQASLAAQRLTDVEGALLQATELFDGAQLSGAITPLEHTLLAGATQQVSDLGFSILRPTATADTYLKQGTPNKNQGTDSIMRIRQSGKNRGLVRFDDAVFAGVTGQIVRARIEVDIVFNANNWGTTGRTVDAHRMLVAWTELGATWNCGDDSDTSDQSPDCGTTAWEMRSLSPSPFEPTPSGTLMVTKDLTGVVSFDVTDDVRAIVAGQVSNFGWILKKTKEGQPGHIQLGTKESGAPARLVIEVLN